MREPRALVCMLGILELALTCTARAGNDDTYFMSSQAALVGGALAASTRDAGSVWYNPAGLGLVERQQLDLSLTVGAWQRREIGSGLATTLDGRELTSKLDGSRTAVVSPSTVYVRRLPRLTFGGGLFVSRDDVSDMAGEATASDDALDATSYMALSTAETRYHFGAAAGFAIHERVRLGFGVFGIYDAFDSDLRFSLHLDDADMPEQNLSVQADERNRTTRYALEATAGLQVDVHEHIVAGVLLRSPIVLLHERLDLRDATSVALESDPDAFMLNSRPRKAASAGLLEPARIILSLAVQRGPWGVSVEADWAHALQSQNLSLQGDQPQYLVNRHALWNVRAGVRWDASEALRVGVGVFTDRSPKKGSTFVNDFDVDYYGATAGAIFTERVGLDEKERTEDLLFLTSLSLRYAVGTGDVAQVRFAPETLDIDFSHTVDVLFHELYVMVGSGLYF